MKPFTKPSTGPESSSAAAIPPAPPRLESRKDSIITTRKTSPREAPTARIMPISCVRSKTAISVVFMTPATLTSTAMATIERLSTRAEAASVEIEFITWPMVTTWMPGMAAESFDTSALTPPASRRRTPTAVTASGLAEQALGILDPDVDRAVVLGVGLLQHAGHRVDLGRRVAVGGADAGLVVLGDVAAEEASPRASRADARRTSRRAS